MVAHAETDANTLTYGFVPKTDRIPFDQSLQATLAAKY